MLSRDESITANFYKADSLNELVRDWVVPLKKKAHRAGAHWWPSSLYDLMAAFLSERDGPFKAHNRT
ncbi:MAG: hypothetical protein WCD69_10415, partial [Xanthobacteraceae bacterium]